MSRKKYSPEQIIIPFREVEVLCSRGYTLAEAARKIGECLASIAKSSGKHTDILETLSGLFVVKGSP